MEYVYVAIYTHKYGYDVAVYRTEEGARAWGESLARDYWDDWYDEPMPTENVAEAYFNGMADICGDEWFVIERRGVEA